MPTSLRKQCLNELHSTHFGAMKMKSLARSYFWWPRMDQEIESLSNKCDVCCQFRKAPPKVKLHSWSPPREPNDRVHADFGHVCNKTFLVLTDQYSKWMEVYFLTLTTAEQTICRFKEFCARWGIMRVLVTDNGPPFSSAEFAQFTTRNGIKHLFSPP